MKVDRAFMGAAMKRNTGGAIVKGQHGRVRSQNRRVNGQGRFEWKVWVGTLVAGIGLLLLAGNVEGAVVGLSSPCGAGAAWRAMDLVGCVIVELAAEALQTCLLEHQALAQSAEQMLLSFWLVVLGMAGMFVLRAVFGGGDGDGSGASKTLGK